MVVFLWYCFCGGRVVVFFVVVVGGVVVFLWWCFCGGGVVVFFVVMVVCLRGGVFVVMWWYFCGDVVVVLQSMLIARFSLIKGISGRSTMQALTPIFHETDLYSFAMFPLD